MNGVFGSSVLEVAIGLAYVYLLLAVFCTALNEWLSGTINKRGKLLEDGLRQLLDNQPHPDQPSQDPKQQSIGFAKLFEAHPLIAGLKRAGSSRLPSYLSPASFATAVIHVVTAGRAGAIAFADLETDVKALPDGDVKKTLLALLQTCGGSLDQARKNIEDWYTEFMDRVSGWYKRWIQLVTIGIALLLCAGLNADSIRIARSLWQDTALRGAIVEQAKGRAAGAPPAVEVHYDDRDKPTKPTAKVPPPLSAQEMKALDQVLGWQACPSGLGAWTWWLLGVVLSTVAVSLGAPFWFDTLKRLVNLRTSGTSPDERAKQRSKGVQP
jgi:hypothetical protein